MRRWLTTLLVAATVPLTGCAIEADQSGRLSVGLVDAITSIGQHEASFSWQGAVTPGLTLEIKGVNGSITAEPGIGPEVEVEATKRGRRNDPDSVRIEVVEHEGGVTLCAVYPSTDDRANACAPGEGGRLQARNNDVHVEFVVKVPAGVHFVGRTVNGKVVARDLTARVEARTVNGSVDLSTTGPGLAHTVNGSIDASVGASSGDEPLEFETVNGSIVVRFDGVPDAEIEAQTVNGGIATDYPLTVRGRFGPKRLSGTLGAGGRSIALETVNGSISLRQAS